MYKRDRVLVSFSFNCIVQFFYLIKVFFILVCIFHFFSSVIVLFVLTQH
jgi:hypothetical protein